MLRACHSRTFLQFEGSMETCGLIRTSIWLSALASAAVIGVAGCGGSSRPQTIPISGLITIDGQPPGEGGKLFFTPTKAADGYALRPASGSFSAQGTYRVMSWAPDDGLVPGHYTVAVSPGDPAKTRVPLKYHQSASSGLELEVPIDGSSIDYNIDVRTN
jgi:hypothetical protein